MKKGYFITFEGAEGSGKSTQIRNAVAFLKEKGRTVVMLREPAPNELVNPAIEGTHQRLLIPRRATQRKQDRSLSGESRVKYGTHTANFQAFSSEALAPARLPLPHNQLASGTETL